MPIQKRFKKDVPPAVTSENKPRRLSPKAAAIYIGVSVDVVRKLIEDGTIPHARNGTRYLLDVRDLDRYIERSKLGVVAYG
jgi:excisionase family DNA binding protein